MKLKFILLQFVLLISLMCNASDYYWVGNSGNWSDYLHHWATTSGGNTFQTVIPTPLDNVIFDANSFTLTGQTVIIDNTTAECKNMSWTGVTGSPDLQMFASNTLHIFGSLTLAPNMNLNLNNNISFKASSPGQTITSAGKSFTSSIIFNGTGTWTLLDDLTVSSIEIDKGNLNTNNKTISASLLLATGTQVSSLNLGSSMLNLNGWNVSTSPNFTLNSGTATINFNSVVDFYGGSRIYNNVNFNSASGVVFIADDNIFNGPVTLAGNAVILGNNTFNDLSLSPGHNYQFTSFTQQILNGNLNAIGTGSFPIRIESDAPGIAAIISKPAGSICLDYVRMSDITATGGAFFNAGLSPSRSLDMGGNSGWVFTGASTAFYRDADGDGYGIPTINIFACTPPVGYVTNNGDCNDADAAIHPGAIEICNEMDDNCNGVTDEACTPLPVSLSTFTVRPARQDAVLEWITLQELNSKSFTIQRSIDGSNFQEIGTVAAAGASSLKRVYSFFDKDIISSGYKVVYYRLVSFDNDGRSGLSTVITLKIKTGNLWAVSILGNPVKDEVRLVLIGITQNLRLSVFDVNGKKLKANTRSAINGQLSIPVTELPRGNYMLMIETGNERRSLKFVK